MRAKDISDAYEALPPVTLAGYSAGLLIQYVHEQFAAIHAEGWRTFPDDLGKVTPGAAPDLHEVARTRVLPVYDRDHEGHTLFTPGVNYMFRAVHDVRGHLDGDPIAPFGFEGETVAWKRQDSHLRKWWRHSDDWRGSYLTKAREILFSEIVGQAAYFETHGRFPGQKVVLLPLSLSGE